MGRQIDKFVPLRVRAAALMPAAVLTVHQLRFQLAFGDNAHAKLAAEGHQYLGAVAVAAAMLLATGIGVFLAGLVRTWRLGPDQDLHSHGRAPLLKTWLFAAVLLLAIYCGQELLEGILVTGHPGGLAGVFGEGGLWALPLSALLGGVVALALQVAEVAIDWVVAHNRRPDAARPLFRRAQRPTDFIPTRREPLAGAAAGRAPPAPLPLTS